MYRAIVTPLLNRLDSEKMHYIAKQALHAAELLGPVGSAAVHLASGPVPSDPRLETTVAGVRFRNPVLVGAGWDKSGEAVRALSWMGFAGVEVGTVTELPQPGNPRPRQWIVGDGVAINWLGFNGPGMEVAAQNLSRYASPRDMVIGINVGKNKEVSPEAAPEKHAIVARRLGHLGDYITINVASPNTPGLRDLLAGRYLEPIIRAVQAVIQEKFPDKPLFVKISPDMSSDDLDAAIDVCLSLGVTGITASNTTVREDLKAQYGERWRKQPGGLSGNNPAYREMVDRQIAQIRKRAGTRLSVMGVGGVDSAHAALKKILCGASVVQMVVGIRGRGPAVVRTILQGMLSWMDRNKVRAISEAVGQADVLPLDERA